MVEEKTNQTDFFLRIYTYTCVCVCVCVSVCVYTCMHLRMVNDKDHEFERDQGKVWERF